MYQLNRELSDDMEFETLVISRVKKMAPEQKAYLCQSLSYRKSPQAIACLKDLLQEKHSGVRLAAAVSLTIVDPLQDITSVRNKLIEDAAKSPEEFAIAFDYLEDAVRALALAGQSYDEAEVWLRSIQNPAIQAVCQDTAEGLDPELRLGPCWKGF